VDVDDVYEIEDILPAADREQFSIHIAPAASAAADPLVLGYITFDKWPVTPYNFFKCLCHLFERSGPVVELAFECGQRHAAVLQHGIVKSSHVKTGAQALRVLGAQFADL
jgi:hypothetical protein